MTDTPTIRRAQFRGVTLSRDDLVAEARKYMDEHPGWPELGDTSDIMADFAMMIAARVALRMALPPGYVVVPREPTEAMETACIRASLGYLALHALKSIWPWHNRRHVRGNIRACYRAMIAAATKESEG